MYRRPPMRHQAHALKWARGRTTLPLLWRMRLGKTLVAIRWAADFPGSKLVVAPFGVLYAWRDELSLEGRPACVLTGTQDARLDLLERSLEQGVNWYLINYEGLVLRGDRRALPAPAALFPWGTVILDESVRIKNPQAKVTKVVARYLSQAPHKAILSGLPNPEGPLDFFEQFRFLYGRFCGESTYWHFRDNLFLPDARGFNWTPRVGTLRAIREEVHEKASVLDLQDVGLGNVRMKEVRYVVLPPRVRRAYEKVVKDFVLGEQSTKWSTVQAEWLMQLAGGFPKEPSAPTHDAKVRELLDLWHGELRGEPLVIWFTHRREGREVERRLREAGHRVRRVTGDTPVRRRHFYQQQFKGGHLDAILMQVRCGKYGLDLSHASTAVYYSLPFSHDDYAQSVERIEHPKKVHPLLVIHLLAKDTVDEHVSQVLMGKRLNATALLRRILVKLKEQYSGREHER